MFCFLVARRVCAKFCSVTALPFGEAVLQKKPERLRSSCRLSRLSFSFGGWELQKARPLEVAQVAYPNLAFLHLATTFRTLAGHSAVARPGPLQTSHMLHFRRKSHWWLDKWWLWHLRTGANNYIYGNEVQNIHVEN